MAFLDLVNERRSVRAYTDQVVPRDILNRCLEAARLAPSACNSQPWQFIVVDEPGLCRKLGDAAFSGLHAMNAFAKKAPVLVAVVRGRSKPMAQIGGQVKGIEYGLVDLGIAIEHFVLQAAEEGVGTCWLGWFDEGAVRRVLGIPQDRKVDMMLSVGYAAQDSARDKMRKSLGEMSRFL